MGRNRTSASGKKRKLFAPRTAKQYFAMPERSRDIWNRVTHVVSKMRADKLSLQQTSREFGLDPHTVLGLVRPTLRKNKSGRYAAKRSDKLLRVLVVPTPEGLRETTTRDSRQASLVGEYGAAVEKYLRTGDASTLERFRRKRVIDASRKRIPLLTDLDELDRQASAGVLSFESLYVGG